MLAACSKPQTEKSLQELTGRDSQWVKQLIQFLAYKGLITKSQLIITAKGTEALNLIDNLSSSLNKPEPAPALYVFEVGYSSPFSTDRLTVCLCSSQKLADETVLKLDEVLNLDSEGKRKHDSQICNFFVDEVPVDSGPPKHLLKRK